MPGTRSQFTRSAAAVAIGDRVQLWVCRGTHDPSVGSERDARTANSLSQTPTFWNGFSRFLLT